VKIEEAMRSRFAELAGRAEAPAFAALRIVAGALFSFHGMQKLFGWPQGQAVSLLTQLGAAGVIELGCGVLVAIGLFVRPAAFLASGEMAVAYFQGHWKLHFANDAWLPVVNRGELAVIYCFLFLFIAAHGAGVASVGCYLRKGRSA
jgi:putative oxidoreductase